VASRLCGGSQSGITATREQFETVPEKIFFQTENGWIILPDIL